MGWEQRGHRRYFYRTHRVGSRFVREYVGGGLAGYLAAQEHEERRKEHAAARAALERDQEAFAAAAASHQTLERIVDGLMTAALAAAGYHRHDRGQWRKRRAGKDD